jgi:septin family protein
MKLLGSRVNLIPVIAKADTLTPATLEKFKQNVNTPSPYLPLLLTLSFLDS